MNLLYERKTRNAYQKQEDNIKFSLKKIARNCELSQGRFQPRYLNKTGKDCGILGCGKHVAWWMIAFRETLLLHLRGRRRW
jgi:hypothetical protein